MWVETAVLLRCRTEDLAREVRSIAALREFVRGELSPRDLIIDRTRAEEFLNLLQEHGFMPLPGILEAKAEAVEEHDQIRHPDEVEGASPVPGRRGGDALGSH